MTNPAGPRRCECHPGIKEWHPPVELAHFWHTRSGFGARFRFCNPNKNKFISMKANSNLNHFQQLLFLTFPFPRLLNNLFFFVFTKNGCQNRCWVPKLSCFDGRVPKVSSRVTLPTSGAGVVCHKQKILKHTNMQRYFSNTINCFPLKCFLSCEKKRGSLPHGVYSSFLLFRM